MSNPLIKRTITAGPLVMVALYPAASTKDGATARQKKRELSTRAQQLMNLKYAWQKLKLLIAANFGPKDLFLTLTYTDECLPSDRDQVMRDVAAFVKSLRRHRPGQELRYIYCIEHKHGEGRWHVHMLLNSTGDDFDLILRLWKRGGVEFKKIRVDREKNYESLARYFCKEPRDKPGDCLWSGSKKLRKPVGGGRGGPATSAGEQDRLPEPGAERDRLWGPLLYGVCAAQKAGVPGSRPAAAKKVKTLLLNFLT